MSLLDRLQPRRNEANVSAESPTAGDAVYGTKALRKFLKALTERESPALLDLGPVVGSNVSFFGEQLGCKIFVEDIYADLNRHVRERKLDVFAEFLKKRFPQPDATFDGILCWDLIDYLDRPAAQELAIQLTRLLRQDGALLAFFGTGQANKTHFTKYLVVDEMNLRHRTYEAPRGRQAVLVNRDILRLFPNLRVSDSFLLQNHLREILFRKT